LPWSSHHSPLCPAVYLYTSPFLAEHPSIFSADSSTDRTVLVALRSQLKSKAAAPATSSRPTTRAKWKLFYNSMNIIRHYKRL
jgi:hypothetical protein